jgi:hypothetical protein
MAASAKLTGGAGHDLQHRVATSYLTGLLCRGLVPFVSGGQVEKITLEAGVKHWKTDDILLQGTNAAGRQFTIAIQVKRNCDPAASGEFADFITKAWADWNNSAVFNRDTDRLILTASFASGGLRRFQQLIEVAQATLTYEEFANRLAVPRFLSVDASNVWTNIQAILGTATSEDIWLFLRSCGLALTDLDVAHGYHESLNLSLLASNCTEIDGPRVAAETWRRLFDLASRDAGNAKEFTYPDLPEELRQRHGPVKKADYDALKQIDRDTERVLAHIRTEISSGEHIPRLQLESEIFDLMQQDQVVLIAGHSGSGKSAIAKQVLNKMSANSLVMGFRSEEFAFPHLRSVPSFHGLSFDRIQEITANFPRRLVLIESAERLLESTSREAFSDFLREFTKDPNSRVIITARAYSSETVREAFLQPLNLALGEITVPQLSDEELSALGQRVTQLAVPLASSSLKRLLRYPFLVNMASLMQWESGEAFPSVERDFRSKVWRDIVQRLDQQGDGMPLRRGKTYMACARQRAEKLMPFVSADNYDLGAVERLINDGLLLSSDKSTNLVAPSHDVLEDWALLQSLSEAFEGCQSNLAELLRNEKPYPALRRAFGKWLDEWIEVDPVNAGKSVIDVMRTAGIPQLWQDECFAAILRSSHGAAFIAANRDRLLANDGELLFRAVHLCRIIATRPNPALAGRFGFMSGTRVPVGPAWSSLLALLRQNLGLIKDIPRKRLVANYLDDWSRSITNLDPYPEGSRDAALICISQVAEDADDLGDSLKFGETVIKIPLEAGENLFTIVRGLIEDRHFNRHRPGLPELMLNGLKCYAVCRDIPDLVIEVLYSYLNPPLDHHRDDIFGSGPSREVEAVFGLRPYIGLGGGSASAFRGPYFSLLVSHSRKGLDLIIGLINRAVEAYANRSPQRESFEVPESFAVELPDGRSKQVWGSWRLWGGFRGETVMPHELESALMALELWLLQKTDIKSPDVASILTEIVERTNNVALLAVVASVANSDAAQAGAAAYSVLTVPTFFEWDMARKIHDPTAMEDAFQGLLPRFNADEGIYISERKAARARKHRERSIEDLCRQLQYTPLRDKVVNLLDRFRTAITSAGPDDPQNVTWFNVVNRMDIRNLHPTGEVSNGMIAVQADPLPGEFNDRIQEMQPAIASSQAAMVLWNWGLMAFKNDFRGEFNASQWHDVFKRTRDLKRVLSAGAADVGDDQKFLDYAAGHVAAVMVRDHLPELSEDEVQWCEAIICGAVLEEADVFDDFNSEQRHAMHGSRPAGYVVSHLAKYRASPIVDVALATALTHSVNEVRHYAIAGFRTSFEDWDSNRNRNALGAFIAGAVEYTQLVQTENTKPWTARKDRKLIEAEVFKRIRSAITNKEDGGLDQAAVLSLRDEAAYKFYPIISDWLATFGDTSAVRAFFKLNAAALGELYRDDEHYEVLYGAAGQAFEQTLARFLLNLPTDEAITLLKPLLSSLDDKPDKPSHFLDLMTLAADRYSKSEQFWPLWEEYAKSLTGLTKRSLTRRDGSFAVLIKGLFMVVDLNEGVEKWHLLTGKEDRVLKLFSNLPPLRSTLGLFLDFLHSTGKNVLEEGLISVQAKLTQDPNLLSESNVRSLELILGPPIYATPARLKKNSGVREAVLNLLDEMINAGSTAAYFLRNDFATPYVPG